MSDYVKQKRLHTMLDTMFSHFRRDGLRRYYISKLKIRLLYDPGDRGLVTISQIFLGAPTPPEQDAHALGEHVAVAAKRWGFTYRDDIGDPEVLIIDTSRRPLVVGEEG